MKQLIIFHINITTFVQSGEGNVQARLHDRKIGYGPDKERVRTPHFCPCKLCGSCLLAWVRTRVFFGFGAIGGYGPKNQKKKHVAVPVS